MPALIGRLVVWGGTALIGGAAVGGYSGGKKIGQALGDALPLIVLGGALYYSMKGK